MCYLPRLDKIGSLFYYIGIKVFYLRLIYLFWNSEIIYIIAIGNKNTSSKIKNYFSLKNNKNMSIEICI